MKHLAFALIALLIAFSCSHSIKKNVDENEVTFNDSNELQFTFLVFDKQKTDTFFSRYEPFDANNKLFNKDIAELKALKFSTVISKENNLFRKNSEIPNQEDFEIALDDLKESYYEDQDEYFDVGIEFLFFYHCLPVCFQNKWSQTTEGDFKFNSTFFALLREKSQIIDQLIYGEIGTWDEKLIPIFGEHIFNEITPDQARKIKKLLLKEKVFNDMRFRADREKFISFLDKTINNKWRLILTDWN